MGLLVSDSNRGGFLNMSVSQRKIRDEKLAYVYHDFIMIFILIDLNIFYFAEPKKLQEPKEI